MVQGLLRASGIVDDSRHHTAGLASFPDSVGCEGKGTGLFLREIGSAEKRRRAGCLGHFSKAWVGQFWRAPKRQTARLLNNRAIFELRVGRRMEFASAWLRSNPCSPGGPPARLVT